MRHPAVKLSNVRSMSLWSLEDVLQLAPEQFVAVTAASDFCGPVAYPSGQKLDGLRGELGSVGDAVGAL
ncbi:hypothetical protein STRTUCAR8_06042 [Streptomyces turgidiscabies Car8]|uniref:Uncharacterized protein n=2 Tax=Streptomyces TaxID=1883 RepID=L7FAG0_STRT8|nr:hypothetical protein STRTUCAR8_06042 [Streptomyces turgidiscabies Car8]